MPPQSVRVLTNSFVIKSLPKLSYIQYEGEFDVVLASVITDMLCLVSFGPGDIKAAPKRQRLVHNMQIAFPAIFTSRALYDGGALLYTPVELTTTVFRVHGSNQSAPPDAYGWYEVRLTRTSGQVINSQSFTSIFASSKTTSESASAANLLQLMLCQTQNQDQPGNKKAYFFEQGKMRIPKMPIELWHGFHQAVRPSPGRLLVTVDTTVAAMYMSGSLMDAALAVLGANDVRRLGPDNQKHPDFITLQKFFKKKQIYVKNLGKRVKTIYALMPGPVGPFEFQSKGNGPMTTIAEHYKAAHNIRLQYPNTVGVVTSGKSAPFPVVIPMELCEIVPGQPYKKKLPPDAGATVISFSVLKPEERLAKITGGTHGVASPVQTYGTSEFMAEAGVEVSTVPMTVMGSLLEVPPLIYNNKKLVARSLYRITVENCLYSNNQNPRDGSWNVLGSQFNSPANIQKWGLVNLIPGLPYPRVQSIMKQLADCCENLGMKVTPPPDGAIVQGNPGSVRSSLENVCRVLDKPDIILVLLPANAEDLRAEVKHTGDIVLGVRTQCLRQSKLPQEGPRASQYYNNVALKVNARMGGRNALVKSAALLEVSQAPFMIFGADVAHPGPGQARPSVVSLVWSMDQYGATYSSTTRLQPPRTEIIVDLKAMFKQAIVMFGNKFRRTPARVFFFRDGVSEGEFTTVSTEEIVAIKAAIDEVWTERKVPAVKPTLTFLVVGKRHHVSFFPSPQDRAVGDRTGNCRAGLAVDNDLRNPQFKDFYLQSHAAIKGTSRSAHYTILLDENFNENLTKLQELSFALCHIYAKATRSVSIPAPVYYADLACARGKFHIQPGSDVEIDGSTTTGGSNKELDLDKWQKVFKDVHPNMLMNMPFL
ncbi:Argonaute-like protein [Mycena indigotica]|uniref:Argonaute-like protein n=1 Tax=Mycena indigotica TaxID=2126181 RepID=A0A8H6SAD1_9AGAR|nr:Argonaute-like protein [Mycena indigotica]KAF7295312.1 Argonaute-like protein [Mycena indigotica]